MTILRVPLPSCRKPPRLLQGKGVEPNVPFQGKYDTLKRHTYIKFFFIFLSRQVLEPQKFHFKLTLLSTEEDDDLVMIVLTLI